MPTPTVHRIESIARLEARLKAARARAAAALRRQRERADLSLREAAPLVGLSPAGLSLLERGETWETTTARRVLAAYDTAASAVPEVGENGAPHPAPAGAAAA